MCMPIMSSVEIKSYSEPHCTLSEKLAAKVLKQYEKEDSYMFVLIYLMS